MDRLLEYTRNHPLLVGLALLLALAVLAFEWRKRGQDYAAVQPQEAIRLMNQGAHVIDLRDAQAFAAGHVTGAKQLTADQLANAADSLKKYKEKVVLLYCENGAMAADLARKLHAGGFTRVFNLRGGLATWRADGLPLQRG
jgi:rhodanese-related sulfurtransferase